MAHAATDTEPKQANIVGPRIVLICAYPRSGSNWVGDALSLAESARVGVNPEKHRLFHDLEVLRAKAQLELFYSPTPRMVFMKTHELPWVLAERSPGLGKCVRACVHIVRHPLDVLASSFRYMLQAGRVTHDGRVVRTMDEARELGLFDRYADQFIRCGGDPSFTAAGYGTWAEHTYAWSGERALSGAPVIQTQFSDLVADPRNEFAKIAKRIPMMTTREQLDSAVEMSTPERTARLLGREFVHKGADRGYADTLSPDQIERGLTLVAPPDGTGRVRPAFAAGPPGIDGVPMTAPIAPPPPGPGGRRVVFVASYPRSGNNWIGKALERMLLIAGGNTEAGLRGQPGLYHDIDLYVRRKIIDQLYEWSKTYSLLLKTHCLPGVLDERVPRLTENATGTITVIRHPLDVMTSCFRFLLWSKSILHEGRPVTDMDRARRLGLFDRFVDEFIEHRGYPGFVPMGFGTWESHAAAWSSLEDPRFASVFVRYRDLVERPIETFADIRDRLDLHLTDEQIGEGFGFADKSLIQNMFGKGFVHRGADRSYEDTLSPEQVERAQAVFADEIERYAL